MFPADKNDNLLIITKQIT